MSVIWRGRSTGRDADRWWRWCHKWLLFIRSPRRQWCLSRHPNVPHQHPHLHIHSSRGGIAIYSVVHVNYRLFFYSYHATRASHASVRAIARSVWRLRTTSLNEAFDAQKWNTPVETIFLTMTMQLRIETDRIAHDQLSASELCSSRRKDVHDISYQQL